MKRMSIFLRPNGHTQWSNRALLVEGQRPAEYAGRVRGGSPQYQPQAIDAGTLHRDIPSPKTTPCGKRSGAMVVSQWLLTMTTLLCFSGSDMRADEVVSPSAGGKISAQTVGLRPLSPKQFQFSGEIGRRFMLTVQNNLLALEKDQFLQPFRDDGRISGGYVGTGKLLDAAVHFAVYCEDKEVADEVVALKDHVVQVLLQTQLPNGYLGCMGPSNRMKTEYDIHEQGYVILGLTENYLHFEHRPSLEAARKAADFLETRWDEATHPNLTTLGVPEAFVALSQATGDPHYATFAETTGMGRELPLLLRQWTIRPGEGEIYSQNRKSGQLAALEIIRL